MKAIFTTAQNGGAEKSISTETMVEDKRPKPPVNVEDKRPKPPVKII